MAAISLQQTKSVLAKLMAGENISVVHQNCQTASFDLKSRTLYCPIWEVIDGDLYDLLMGHEVSHALYTPLEGWHHSTTNLGIHRSILNVVEDARCEKLVKRKYPGLGRSFARAYKQLHERNFFGIKNLRSLDSLNLVDRINVYFKIGAYLPVPFSSEEYAIVQQVSAAETWDDVVAAARIIHDAMKGDINSKINDLSQLVAEIRKQRDEAEAAEQENASGEHSDNRDEDDADGEEGDSSNAGAGGDNDVSDDDDGEEGDGADDGSSNMDDLFGSYKEQLSDATGGGASSNREDSLDDVDLSEDSVEQLDKKIEDEIASVTDTIFRARETELACENLIITDVAFPEPILENIIMPFDEVYDMHMKRYYHGMKDSNVAAFDSITNAAFVKYNGAYINLLVKQFMMKKRASEYSRQQVSRSGELDMNKLHQYKYVNDLFAKMTVIPKGKSHGLVLFLDLSGSMRGSFAKTVRELLVLASFCRRVNIPFDIYGFCDSSASNAAVKYNRLKSFKPNDKVEMQSHFHLKHFLSSSFSPSKYKKGFNMLLSVPYFSAVARASNPMMVSPAFTLGGTPLISTIAASREIIEKFKAAHKLDVVNVIHLTDGEGADYPNIINLNAHSIDRLNKNSKVKTIFRFTDRKTKKTMIMSGGDVYSIQGAFTSFVRELTGCKNIGYYIADLGKIKNKTGGKDAALSLKKYNFFQQPHLGYDSYYFIASHTRTANGDDVSFDDMDVKKAANIRKIAAALTNQQANKKARRAFAVCFMDEIV